LRLEALAERNRFNIRHIGETLAAFAAIAAPLAEVLQAANAPPDADPPDAPPDGQPDDQPEDQDPAEGQIVDEVIRLERETTIDVRAILEGPIPEPFRVSWDYTGDGGPGGGQPAEPAPTDERVALNVFSLHGGGPWAGQRRLAVTAVRQHGESSWILFVGQGQGRQGGGTVWAQERSIPNLTWAEVLRGYVEVGGAYSRAVLVLPDGRGRAFPWTSDPSLRYLHIGHKDRNGQEGRGDEPFPEGVGRIILESLSEAPAGDVDAEDATPDVADAVLDVLTATPAQLRARGPSGDVGNGLHPWVRGFNFPRFMAKAWTYFGPPSWNLSPDEWGQLAEQHIRGGDLDTEDHLRNISRLQNPRTFIGADVEAFYGGATRGSLPPWKGVYAWPEVEGGSEVNRQHRAEMRRLFEMAIKRAPNWQALQAHPSLWRVLQAATESQRPDRLTYRDILEMLVSASDDTSGPIAAHHLAFWRNLATRDGG